MDFDILIHGRLEFRVPDGHGVVPRWQIAIDDESLIIGDSKERPNQGGAVELDFDAGNYTSSLIGHEGAETADRSLRRRVQLG